MTFSLDIDVIIAMKEEKNKSTLINNYLKHYFKLKNAKPTTKK